MKSNEKLTIALTCNHPEWRRFNASLQAETLNEQGERITAESLTQTIANVGDNLREKPSNPTPKSKLEMSLQAAQTLHLYLNIIPHSLPLDSAITFEKGLAVRLVVRRGTTTLLDEKIALNPWSGAIFETRL